MTVSMSEALQRAEAAVGDLAATRRDRWYPRFHIAGVAGWINDPNGLCYFNGRYHVFFQHYPYGTDWGLMHWGHVSSADLITWRREPIAMAPSLPADRDGVFSGSAVVADSGELYAYYTGHVWNNGVDFTDGVSQRQILAVSADGNHFDKVGVVIDNPDGVPQFRDPKVWRQGNTWYLVVGVGTPDGFGEVWLYDSDDLRDWRFERVLYRSSLPGTFMLECPDFFPFGDRWVLLFCPMRALPDGYERRNIHNVGYVVGHWQPGSDFEVIAEHTELDRGGNFYAPQTFEAPDGRRLLFGWMGGGPDQPMPSQADGWCSQLTVPRQLGLTTDNKLTMWPVAEVEALRSTTDEHGALQLTEDETRVVATDLTAGEIDIEIDLAASTAERIGLAVHKTPGGDETLIAYDVQTGRLVVDRRHSGAGQRGYRSAAVRGGTLRMRILLDASSVEVFLDEGREALSLLVFPGEGERSVELFSEAGTASVTKLNVHRMGSSYERH
ncbi:glycoside hydrolase family 32 protein [Micropruina sp.]|uniref:glycoside hydrolase family 32 protein n=1 Tax=Micropruina sp. TaxID=2737536 RepID=UPI0039E2D6F6